MSMMSFMGSSKDDPGAFVVAMLADHLATTTIPSFTVPADLKDNDVALMFLNKNEDENVDFALTTDSVPWTVEGTVSSASGADHGGRLLSKVITDASAEPATWSPTGTLADPDCGGAVCVVRNGSIEDAVLVRTSNTPWNTQAVTSAGRYPLIVEFGGATQSLVDSTLHGPDLGGARARAVTDVVSDVGVGVTWWKADAALTTTEGAGNWTYGMEAFPGANGIMSSVALA